MSGVDNETAAKAACKACDGSCGVCPYVRSQALPSDRVSGVGVDVAAAQPKCVSDRVKAKMIAAYPSISGMSGEFLAWHATPEERDEAWLRITEARHLRDVLDATYPQGWVS